MVLVTMKRFNAGGDLVDETTMQTEEPKSEYAESVAAAHGWIVRAGNAGAVLCTYSDGRPCRLVTVAGSGNWNDERLEDLVDAPPTPE